MDLPALLNFLRAVLKAAKAGKMDDARAKEQAAKAKVAAEATLPDFTSESTV